ncbi:unnamed protein product [Durusdinium trenchii]|uniref:Uncharacterized protein n=1 Tax=Durusdinium trenchii TaxID=1381693 RepID=A0ABP0PSY5_9DINO
MPDSKPKPEQVELLKAGSKLNEKNGSPAITLVGQEFYEVKLTTDFINERLQILERNRKNKKVVANFDFVLTWVSVSEFAFAPPTKKEVQAKSLTNLAAVEEPEAEVSGADHEAGNEEAGGGASGDEQVDVWVETHGMTQERTPLFCTTEKPKPPQRHWHIKQSSFATPDQKVVKEDPVRRELFKEGEEEEPKEVDQEDTKPLSVPESLPVAAAEATKSKNVRAALEKDIEDLLKKLGSGRTELQTALESGVEVPEMEKITQRSKNLNELADTVMELLLIDLGFFGDVEALTLRQCLAVAYKDFRIWCRLNKVWSTSSGASMNCKGYCSRVILAWLSSCLNIALNRAVPASRDALNRFFLSMESAGRYLQHGSTLESYNIHLLLLYRPWYLNRGLDQRLNRSILMG